MRVVFILLAGLLILSNVPSFAGAPPPPPPPPAAIDTFDDWQKKWNAFLPKEGVNNPVKVRCMCVDDDDGSSSDPELEKVGGFLVGYDDDLGGDPSVIGLRLLCLIPVYEDNGDGDDDDSDSDADFVDIHECSNFIVISK